jgi:hypothetical protein
MQPAADLPAAASKNPLLESRYKPAPAHRSRTRLIERVRSACHRNGKGLVIVVFAYLSLDHGRFPQVERSFRVEVRAVESCRVTIGSFRAADLSSRRKGGVSRNPR